MNNMELDNKKFKKGIIGASQYYNRVLYYDGKEIGTYVHHQGYPIRVFTLDKSWTASFTSEKEAFKALAIQAGVLGTATRFDGEIFPEEYYILRVSDLTFIYNSIDIKTSKITARVYYNSMKSYGKSALSKPVVQEIMIIDLENEKFVSKKDIQFSNGKYMIQRIYEALVACKPIKT